MSSLDKKNKVIESLKNELKLNEFKNFKHLYLFKRVDFVEFKDLFLYIKDCFVGTGPFARSSELEESIGKKLRMLGAIKYLLENCVNKQIDLIFLVNSIYDVNLVIPVLKLLKTGLTKIKNTKALMHALSPELDTLIEVIESRNIDSNDVHLETSMESGEYGPPTKRDFLVRIVKKMTNDQRITVRYLAIAIRCTSEDFIHQLFSKHPTFLSTLFALVGTEHELLVVLVLDSISRFKTKIGDVLSLIQANFHNGWMISTTRAVLHQLLVGNYSIANDGDDSSILYFIKVTDQKQLWNLTIRTMPRCTAQISLTVSTTFCLLFCQLKWAETC
jgi:hypothetical protein